MPLDFALFEFQKGLRFRFFSEKATRSARQLAGRSRSSAELRERGIW